MVAVADSTPAPGACVVVGRTVVVVASAVVVVVVVVVVVLVVVVVVVVDAVVGAVPSTSTVDEVDTLGPVSSAHTRVTV